MKTWIRVLALLLCTVLLASLVSCKKDTGEEVPEGMQLATAPGDDFRLYIPTSWNPNTAYGVSGGYATMSTQSTVSMVKYPITEAMAAALPEGSVASAARLDWFYQNQCRPTLESLSLGGSFAEAEARADDLINKLNAARYHEKGIVNGEEMDFLQIVTEREGAFYVFAFTVHTSLYARLLPDVEAMLDVFVFAEPYYPDEYVKLLDPDADAPTGMKLASNREVAYLFYVPETWTINREERIFAAYLPEDLSSVSVVPYMPEGANISVGQFFALCRDAMIATAGEGGFTLISETVDRSMGGRAATIYRYRYTVGGVEYEYLQSVVAYKSMIYSLTYTARPEHFEAHLSDVNAMIDAFAFR